MKYLGKISGSGVLQHMGRPLARASYEIEAYQHNQGLLKASGEMSLNRVTGENLAGVSRMQLLTDDGDLLEIKRPNPERPIGRYFDFEVTGNLECIRDRQS